MGKRRGNGDVYGVDVRETDNLFLVAGVTSQAMDHRDVLEAMATAMALRFLSEAAVRAGVGASVRSLIQELMSGLLRTLLDGFASGGRQALARLTSGGLEHSVASHILALATFGLSTLVDAATRAYVLSRSADDAEVFFRPWARDAMDAAALYLASEEGRMCAAELFGRGHLCGWKNRRTGGDLLPGAMNRSWSLYILGS